MNAERVKMSARAFSVAGTKWPSCYEVAGGDRKNGFAAGHGRGEAEI